MAKPTPSNSPVTQKRKTPATAGVPAAAAIEAIRRTKPGKPAAAVTARLYHPGPPIDCEAALTAALAGLRAVDPVFVDHAIAMGGPPPLRLRRPGFAGLVSVIMAQQLSVASASAIDGRLQARFQPFTAETLATASDDDLRACGLSAAKMKTVRAVSAAVLAGTLSFDALTIADPAAAHNALVAVSGIGPWTADIFLLFCLGHPDAWPAGDLALQEAARQALGLDARPDAIAMEALGERWRPHRGVAARLLWSYYRAMKQGREGVIGGQD